MGLMGKENKVIGYYPVSRLPYMPPPPPIPQPPAMAGPSLGQVSIGPIPSLLGAAVGAGTAWVGWTIGREKSGFLSVTGYVVAVAGALGALGGTVGFFGGLRGR